LVPINTPGEILIGGLGVSAGYVNRSDLTESKFIEDTITNQPNEKLYKTGDLARWLPDGNIEYLGRIDNQVKIRGYRIEIEEVKTKINQLSDVREAVVIAKDSANGQKTLISYLVPNLDKMRIPYEEPALFTLNNYQYKHANTANFSKEGLGLSGINETLASGQEIKVYFKLPNVMNGSWFKGYIVWQKKDRVGILLKLSEEEAKILTNSVEYFLSMQYLNGTLCNPSYARSLHKALENKLPEYMVPSKFIVLEELPMTCNGKIDARALTVVESENTPIVEYVEPTTETEKTLSNMWHELLGHKQISTQDSFFDIGGNSLLASRLSILIYKNFNINIPTEILFNSPYISKLAHYIDTKGQDSVINEEMNELIQHDLILDANFRPTRKININAFSDPTAILVTGAAGFLGIHLVRSLLKQTKAKIYCLVRKGKHNSASDKFLKSIKQYQLDTDISLNNSRIIVIAGDLSQKKFGLSSDVYTKLAEYIDLIYHCAAEVHMLANYNKLRAANVFGTVEVIRFAVHKIDKPIHFISTLSAVNIVQDNIMFEVEPDYQVRSLKNGYGISKWVAENLIVQIKKRGLKVFTYRLGNIFGQSNTGLTNLNDFLLITIKGCIQLGYAPNWHEKIKILPVDFVSNIIVAMSLATQNKSDIYQIDQQKGIVWTDLISWLNDYGFKIKLCSVAEWQEYLRNVDQGNALFPFVSYFLAQDATNDLIQEPEVSMVHTHELLSQLNIEIPPIDDTLLANYFNKLTEMGYLQLNQESTFQS
jgi:thioester reductase-like protein